MRNQSGQVVYVEPSEGAVVDLTPVAFELYRQAELVRHPGPGDYLRPLGSKASEFYREAITEGDIHDSYDQGLASTEWWALTLETAAELADLMGL